MKKLFVILLLSFTLFGCEEKLDCYYCGNALPRSEITTTADDYWFCEDCLLEETTYCYSCDNYVYDVYSHDSHAYRCCCCYDLFLGEIKEIKDNAGVWHYACYDCYSPALKKDLIGCEWHY